MIPLVGAILNLILAVVYVGIGTMVGMDLEKQIRRRGWSHFGVSWLTIMYTCGIHHLVHGVHLLAEGRQVGGLDVLAVVMGLPAGGIWAALRVEAARGGRGDRYIPGTPGWLRAGAVAMAVLTLAVTAAVLPWLVRAEQLDTRLLPNILLVLLYLAVGGVLLRGQLRNLTDHGGWSTSGLSLMMIFPTCAMMHLMYVAYAAAGSFAPDSHGLWVDWAGVPAALYFLWVVAGLETGTLRDWNDRFESIEEQASLDIATGIARTRPQGVSS